MAEFRVVFVSSDYDATVSFFTEVMDLSILREFTDSKGCIVLAADGQIEIFDSSAGWGGDGVTGARMAWEIADADAEHERLISVGATIVSPPSPKPWGHKNVVVQGPDGWIITLFEIVSTH